MALVFNGMSVIPVCVIFWQLGQSRDISERIEHPAGGFGIDILLSPLPAFFNDRCGKIWVL